MSFRESLEAAHARIAALEAEVARLRQQHPDNQGRAELERAVERAAESARLTAEAREQLASARTEHQAELAHREHRRALEDAHDEAEAARREAHQRHELRQAELVAERHRAELELVRQQSSAQIRELEGDIEVLLSFDRARAAAHYERRARALREARAAAQVQIAELSSEGGDAITRATNEAIVAALRRQLARLDAELPDLEQRLARVADTA